MLVSGNAVQRPVIRRKPGEDRHRRFRRRNSERVHRRRSSPPPIRWKPPAPTSRRSFSPASNAPPDSIPHSMSRWWSASPPETSPSKRAPPPSKPRPPPPARRFPTRPFSSRLTHLQWSPPVASMARTASSVVMAALQMPAMNSPGQPGMVRSVNLSRALAAAAPATSAAPPQ